MTAPEAQPDPTQPSENFTALQNAVKHFENAWRQDRRPAIDDHLPADETLRCRALIELVHVDLELRLKAGERGRVEDYLIRYPELASDLSVTLELIAAEHKLRRRYEPELGPEEYLQRFPEYRAKLQEALTQHSTLLAGAALPPPDPPVVVPPVVAGYEMLGFLGRGGMGVVYKARHERLNRIVALKMLGSGVHASRDLRARFHIEAEALARLQHPNIVQVYEVGDAGGCPYIAMEFLDGGNLRDLQDGRPVPAVVAAELVETLARAMHVAHLRGIVHRDLKPSNILLRRDVLRRDEGGGRRDEPDTDSFIPPPSSLFSSSSSLILHPSSLLKITDFGLAKHLAEGKGQTLPGMVMGTPGYMAPEQASGRVHDIGPPTDVYALGAILYELLTGKPPFGGDSDMDTIKRGLSEEPPPPSRLGPKVPRDLETICLKCLEKEAAQRYPTAEKLADDLRHFLQGEPIMARPAGRSERVVKWIRRRPAWAALIGVVIAASVLLLGSFAWSYARVRNERDQSRKSLRVARKAVEDLYTRMASERLFDEPQLDPLCQELLEQARSLYEELAESHGDDLEVRRDAALAWFRLGEIHRIRDQRHDAELAYEEAIARQEALLRDDPGEPRHRQDLANSHNWLGELLREAGRPPEVIEGHYRAALKLQQGLVASDREHADYGVELARSYYNLAILERETGQASAACADCDRAVALLTHLHTSHPARASYRQDLARALVNRGILLRQGNSPEQARQDYDRAIELLSRLQHEFPMRAAYKSELAVALQDRGNLFWSQGRPADAERDHKQALTWLRELVSSFSSRPHYRKKNGIVLKNLGSVLATAGDRSAAEQCWSEARAIFTELLKESPEVADYQGLLGMTLGNLGWLRTDEKNWPEARRVIEQGIECLRTSLRANPQHPDYRLELRNQYQDLAWTLVQLRDHAAAARVAASLAGVFPDRAQDSYYGACFLARCVPLTKDDQQSRQYVEEAVVLLQATARKASPSLKRIPEEKQVFEPLLAHPNFESAQRELDEKMRK